MIYNPLVMLLIGAAFGALAKLMDIYTENLGRIFSQLAIWILLGVILVIFCDKKGRACLDIFVFCAGMLAAYYAVAELSGSIWAPRFAYSWAAFSLLSPLFALAVWRAKKGGAIGVIISLGIIFGAFLSSVIVFNGPRVYDYVICLALAYLLFVRARARKSV